MAFTAAKKTFKTSREISQYIRKYYKDIYRAKEEGKKLCWVTGLAPIELLLAADIIPVLPENYNAFCAAKQMGAELCEEAEANGYSTDICSYGRLNLGTVLSGKGVHGPLPEPDFLFCTRNVCNTHSKWWDVLAEQLGKPLFTLDAPQVGKKVKPHQKSYFASQVMDFMEFCGSVSGTKVTETRLMEVLERSAQFGDIWNEIREYRKLVPCPISSSDIFGNMFMAVTLPGSQIAVDLISKLRDEVAEKVENNQGVIPHEKYRLMWDNIAIWYNLGLMNYLEAQGAVSTIETYTCYTGWGAQLDLSHGPYEALIQKYMCGYLNLDLDIKIDLMKKIVEDFKIDGVLLFSNRSCKPYSVGQFDIKTALEKKGVPSVMFEADMVDPRVFSESIIKNRLDAFLEIL